MAQQATKPVAVKAPISKAKVDQPKKARTPLATLTEGSESRKQFDALLAAGEQLSQLFAKSVNLTPRYLWAAKSMINKSVILALRGNRPSPVDRKKQKLEARLAKLTAELAALKTEDQKKA